jgi:hypothetical protein
MIHQKTKTKTQEAETPLLGVIGVKLPLFGRHRERRSSIILLLVFLTTKLARNPTRYTNFIMGAVLSILSKPGTLAERTAKKNLHATLMLWSWGFFLPGGVMLATYGTHSTHTCFMSTSIWEAPFFEVSKNVSPWLLH